MKRGVRRRWGDEPGARRWRVLEVPAHRAPSAQARIDVRGDELSELALLVVIDLPRFGNTLQPNTPAVRSLPVHIALVLTATTVVAVLTACGVDATSAPSVSSDAGHPDAAGALMADAGIAPGSVPSIEPVDGAYCALDDVATEDLGGWVDEFSPAELPDEPWADVAGRCGDDVETLSWRLMNCERAARGIPPVACDLRLVWAGRQHSVDMRTSRHFGHDSADGRTTFDRLDALGLEWSWAGENLAMYDDVVDAHAGWMRSPAHRRNILNDQYVLGGVGAVQGGERYYLTELFLRP